MSEKSEDTPKTSDFKKHLNVSKNNLNDKLANQASVVYDVGIKLIKLEDALRRLDHEIDLKEAQIYRNMSQKYSALKNITATRINAEVTCHPEVVELKEQRLKILTSIGLAKLKMKTLDTMTDTIINYSHNVREERKSSGLKKT